MTALVDSSLASLRHSAFKEELNIELVPTDELAVIVQGASTKRFNLLGFFVLVCFQPLGSISFIPDNGFLEFASGMFQMSVCKPEDRLGYLLTFFHGVVA